MSLSPPQQVGDPKNIDTEAVGMLVAVALVLVLLYVLSSRSAGEWGGADGEVSLDFDGVEAYKKIAENEHVLGDDVQSKLDKMSDRAIVEAIRRRILPVDPAAVKSVTFEPGHVSETVNKSVIRICVRDNRGRVYPINTLVHVALHELAHTVMTDYDFDHSEKFHSHFDPIVERAVYLKIFDPEEGVSDSYVSMCTRKR